MEPSNNDDYRLNRLHDSLRRLENLDLRDVLDQQGELKYRLDLVRTFHGLFQHRRNPAIFSPPSTMLKSSYGVFRRPLSTRSKC